MFLLREAMRYYRLWIYTCNAVLLISVLVFLAVAIGVLSNSSLSLVPTPPPYHPTFLYGYVALFLQAGILQTIGCLGALKLCEKLLNTYWFLLLSLLLGDMLVGFFWLVRFSNLTHGVRPYLKNTLQQSYGKDSDITDTWNSIQMSFSCCGVLGPQDYRNVTSHFVPDSCCHLSSHSHKMEENQANMLSALKVINEYNSSNTTSTTKKYFTSNKTVSSAKNMRCSARDKVPSSNGCAEHIIKWYRNSAETLMIFGFCVITFVKLCFVGILRFEIQEMIQKIKILLGELAAPPNPELAAALGLMCGDKNVEAANVPAGDAEEANERKAASRVVLTRHNHISTQLDGADSDTNSHCALITDTNDTPIRNPNQRDKRKQNGNNNELTELREFRKVRQTQI